MLSKFESDGILILTESNKTEFFYICINDEKV